MLTSIVIYHGNETPFLATANLFFKQKIFTGVPKKISDLPQLIVLDKTGGALKNESLSPFFKRYGDAVVCIDASNINLAAASNLAVAKATGAYTVFLNSGDTFSPSTLKEVFEFFKKNKTKFSFVCPEISYYFRDQKKYISHFPILTPAIVDLNKSPTLVPLVFSGVVFKTETLHEYPFNEKLVYDYGLDLIQQLLKKGTQFAWVKGATFKATDSLEAESTASGAAMERDWYWNTLNDFLLPLVYSYLIANKKIPEHLQYLALYQLKWRIRLNANNATKHVVDEEVDEFFALCKRIVKYIDTNVLLTGNKTFALPLGLKDLFFRLKYNQTDNVDASHEGYRPNYVSSAGAVYLEQDEALVYKASNVKLLLELLEFDAQHFIVEASLDNYIDFSRCRLNAFFDKQPIEVEETYRYAHTKFFGKSVHKRYTFRLKIPKENLSKTLKLISFEVIVPGGGKIVPTIMTKRFTSRLCSSFVGSYWISNGYLVRFTNNKKSIKIIKASLWNSLKAEFLHMLGMFTGGSKSPEMFKLRCLYWLTYPYFKNKRIWLTFDKLYKAGDCGEYFYKYINSRKEDGIDAAYVVNENYPDYKRLRQEGLNPLIWGSLKQRLYFLHAEVIFETHSGVLGFNSLSNEQMMYLQNLPKFDIACIQHGLTVQSLAFSAHRIFNNTKRYYCASKYEINNLSAPIYGFEEKDALKLTGIPRYDGLINNDKKQILITPTWRNYIAMPSVWGNARPYSESFKTTEYFIIYNNLLSDSRLIETAKKYGYKIIYLLHPVISSQKDDYKLDESVEVVSALDVDYEKILTESSLMVTDYSGVQFDFAYMRKPIVYYHPDELPPHYKEGGFFYDTMGFGEICKQHQEIVDLVCDYMENNCTVKPFYKERQDDFFAFNDLNSCQRIYDDMLEYQRNKQLALKKN